MNKRIKLLSEQAEKYADDNFRGEPIWSEAFESKFAELIVRECANELIKWKEEPFPYDPEFGARLIKQHFGVEE